MKKISKILIISIFVILVYGMMSSVKAYVYNDSIAAIKNEIMQAGVNAIGRTTHIGLASAYDKKVDIDGNILPRSDAEEYVEDLYCIQKGVNLSWSEFMVKGYLHIDGATVFFKEYGKDSISKKYDRNSAVLGYLLGNPSIQNGHLLTCYLNSYNNNNYSLRQQLVYSYMETWYNGFGLKSGWVGNNGQGNNGHEYVPTHEDDICKTRTEAEKYADTISSTSATEQATISNNGTDIKAEVVGDNIRIGPLNWKFTGKLSNITINGDNGIIPVVKYSQFSGNTEVTINNISDIQSGSNFYITINKNTTSTKITKITAKTKYTPATNKKYIVNAWFLVSEKMQNLILVQRSEGTIPDSEADLNLDVDIPITKDLIIIKRDADNANIFLSNVGFIFRCQETGKYVKQDANGKISYVDSKDQATEFVTSSGVIIIKNLMYGTYIATETKNPNYGYEVIQTDTIIDMNTTRITITNKLKYVRLSGYIWEDIHSEKQTVRNDLYKNDINDDNDKAFNGITVRLKDKSGNIIQETKSSELGLYSEIDGGEYRFDNVEISQLANYYVEFEYNGLIWESVTPHIDNNRGSKAIDTAERNGLNKNFASVNSTGENAVNVNNRYRITYKDTVDHKTSIDIENSSDCILHADTDQTGYKLQYDRKSSTESMPEIRYVNLGLYERPQADMALVQDLYNVNLGINGYWHTYNYGSRLDKSSGNVPDDSQLWNVGVKFKNDYTGKYKRAVYKSDVDYTSTEKEKELQVYLTYKIALRNESSYITRVNSIVDYYDDRYKIVAVGTGLSSENAITDVITGIQSSSYNNEYNKAIINVNTTVNPGEVKYIYLQFSLNREAVNQIINNKETLYNVSEINSYTVYKDGNTIAAVDRDSVPGNAKIGNIDTYEDDIDSAPPVQLEITNPRKIIGTVFEDSTSDSLLTGQIRQGDGVFTSGEKTIKDVKVTLEEVNNSIDKMEVTTDQDGNFEFSGFIPGQYIITYTWGDKTYKVQNYKGTVYDSSRNQNDMYWYRQDVETRKTDAIDDYKTRLDIDGQTQKITDNTIYAKIEEAYNGNNPDGIITSMNSTTPKMEFPVEIDPSDFNGTGNRAEFIVKNVDFGIAERARQVLDLDKSVKAFKIALANGQVLADATIDENGKLQGKTDHITYMGPNANNGNNYSGFIKAELDDELIEGSTLEVQYEIKAINNSELDYTSENYYKYGIQEGDLVKLKPSGVVDYLDKNLGFEADKNTDWAQITVNELNNQNAKQAENADFLNSRTLLYTEVLNKELKPTETSSVNLNVSKLLTTSNDLTFYNNAEVTKIQRPGQPGRVVSSFETDDAEEVIIMPSTGEDKSYVLPIIIGTTSLIILCAGVIIIKRKVINK